MTLPELTVAIPFIRVQFWKRDSDRTLCTMRLQNVQSGAQGCSMLSVSSRETASPHWDPGSSGWSAWWRRNLHDRELVLPCAADQFPAVGVLSMTGSLSESEKHQPASFIDW
jgi:hypothetical protein